jgi:dipeptidase D
MSAYESLEPRAVWRIFGEISRVPRCSGQEQAVMAMLREWATARDLQVQEDRVGNLLIRIPASPGREGSEPVLVQGHVDMVCEKNRDTRHDFARDPIQPEVNGEWVRAAGTTLGADNGIGVAMGLAVAEESGLEHGPVEVLLTVDEERGLTGAAGVTPGFFSARRMINLDSEQDDAIFIGCAGGRDSVLTLTNIQARAPAQGAGRKVVVRGLVGGHSGLDIDRNRGNAIMILMRLLHAAAESMDLRIVSLDGGSMRNAIPREAEARVVVPRAKTRQFKKLIDQTAATIKGEELPQEDQGFEVKVGTLQAPRCFSLDSSRRTLAMLLSLPSGVLAMSRDIEGLVETSSNLGVVHTQGAKVEVVCCSRSSVMSSLAGLVARHRAVGELAGAVVVQPPGYPGWQPDLQSPLLGVARRLYGRELGNEPELKAIHAGLECGLLTEKCPDLDIISFGPTILGAHSPDERVSIPSVQKIWRLFGAILADLAR